MNDHRLERRRRRMVARHAKERAAGLKVAIRTTNWLLVAAGAVLALIGVFLLWLGLFNFGRTL